jgi:hypothetical protein
VRTWSVLADLGAHDELVARQALERRAQQLHHADSGSKRAHMHMHMYM